MNWIPICGGKLLRLERGNMNAMINCEENKAGCFAWIVFTGASYPPVKFASSIELAKILAEEFLTQTGASWKFTQ